MYRVMLVDDEVLIREAISENIHWEELGYKLISVCENGKQAIEALERAKPDLILSDICMPYIDGIELTKYVYENHPNIKVIIISGYDNFDYAKSAIKYRVMEYILKPVTAMELSELLQKMKEALDEESVKSGLRKIKEEYENSKPLLKERFLNQLIHGQDQVPDLEGKMNRYEISFCGSCYAVVQILCRSGFEYENAGAQATDELVLFAIRNITEEIFSRHGYSIVFQDPSNVTTVILSEESQFQLEEKITRIFTEIQNAITEMVRVNTVALAGKSVFVLDELPESYQSTVSSREYEFLFEDNSILFWKDFTGAGQDEVGDIARWSEYFVTSVKQYKEENLKQYCQSFFRKLKSSRVSKSRINAYVQTIILKLLLEADGYQKEEQNVFEQEKIFLEELNSQNRIDEVEKLFLDFCLDEMERIGEDKKNLGSAQASKAIEYIDKNYQDPSISLNSVCLYMSMSTSYFSAMFKNYTGETFNQALTKKRMEKAKELLGDTGMRAYEVAEQVGYTDPHYFSSTFKKYEGMTPTEYVRKRRK